MMRQKERPTGPTVGPVGANDDDGRVSSTQSIPQVERPCQLFPDNIPADLREFPTWVCWRREERDGKQTKVPHTTDGSLASVADPLTWTTFDAALDAYSNGGGFDGVGVVLTDEGELFGGDLDHCVMDDGGLETWAAEIVAELGTYTEISPSGKGLRIIGRGKLPPGRRRDGQIELYDSGRYLTITGDHVAGTPATIEDRQTEIEALHARLFPAKEKPRTTRQPAEPVSLDDAELIHKASNANGNGAKFARLWAGDWTGYDSPSEADLALCNVLTFWTAGDPERVDRLFRQSGLMRDKWDRRHYSDGRTYGQATVDKALSDATEFYSPSRFAANSAPAEHNQTHCKNCGEAGTSLCWIDGEGFAYLCRSCIESGGSPIADASPQAVHLTDVGNGRRLVARHGQDLRYCDRLGGWVVWDGRRWELDETGEIERRAKDTVRAIYDEARECTDDDRRRVLFKHALKSEGKYRIAAMTAMAQSELAVVARPRDFDRDRWRLTVNNGTLDLRTGALLPHRRDDLITRLAPVNYDPGAKAPLWLEFLDRAQDGNEALIDFLCRAVGYSLTGSTREQCLFILYGTGANGKSTFTDAVRTLLGDYSQQTPVDTLMIKRGQTIPNDIARLKGTRLVTASEAEEGQRLAESLVKQMTGGDPLAARFLHAEWFEFLPEFKVWLATNHKPMIYGTDNAIWRRIRLIPFTVTIPPEEQDRDLGRKLRAELPGILAWAVRGCLEWQRVGLGAPEEVKQATRGYRDEMDKLGGFLDECCVLNAQAQAGASELYLAYSEWCEANGEKAVSGTRFGRQMAERGFDRERKNYGKVYLGIGLLAHNEGA
jgi:putative DNA primase/helicase